METISQPVERGYPVPEYLIKLWKLNFIPQPNKYSSLIITLIRNSISFERNLTNHQSYQILQALIAITDTPNLSSVLKLEILNYTGHISIKYFTIEYQNEIINSICQLFNRSLNDSDPIIKQIAFDAFARVAISVQHDAIVPGCINDNVSLKVELSDFIKKNGCVVKFPDQRQTFLEHLRSYSFQHKCDGTMVEPQLSNHDDRNLNDNRNKNIPEIIKRMHSDANDLIELNKIHKLTKAYRDDILKITDQLVLLK